MLISNLTAEQATDMGIMEAAVRQATAHNTPAEPEITFRRVVRGYYVLMVDGIERPVEVVRNGKVWLVQASEFMPERRASKLSRQDDGFRNMREAQAFALLVWEAMDLARSLAHLTALELNREVVYVEGHGTRAYELLDYVAEDGVYYVRPLSCGLPWSFDRRAFSTKPFPVPCGCEHKSHFVKGGDIPLNRKHDYLAVPAGTRWAQFVGAVCDTCAETCMTGYLI